MSFYLFGASGHGKVIAEIAEETNLLITAFIDFDQSKTSILDYMVIHEVPYEDMEVIVSIGNNIIRKKIVDEHPHFNYKTLIHPNSFHSKRSEIGEGSVVMAGVSINSDSIIGKHCIINTNASIDHDGTIEDFVHISPNAALAGNVTVGEGTHIGIGACVIQGVTIGKWCTIGAGTVIIKDVPDHSVIVGNPGKIIKSAPSQPLAEK